MCNSQLVDINCNLHVSVNSNRRGENAVRKPKVKTAEDVNVF